MVRVGAGPDGGGGGAAEPVGAGRWGRLPGLGGAYAPELRLGAVAVAVTVAGFSVEPPGGGPVADGALAAEVAPAALASLMGLWE